MQEPFHTNPTRQACAQDLCRTDPTQKTSSKSYISIHQGSILPEWSRSFNGDLICPLFASFPSRKNDAVAATVMSVPESCGRSVLGIQGVFNHGGECVLSRLPLHPFSRFGDEFLELRVGHTFWRIHRGTIGAFLKGNSTHTSDGWSILASWSTSSRPYIFLIGVI